MRRAIIHIGTPRTGTSSLQTLLFIRRDKMLEAGILYPDLTPRSAASPHLSHQHLGEALRGMRPAHERRELLSMLDRILAATAAEVVMLSYESLCLLPPRHRAPRLLRDIFIRRGFRPEILMTVRPQATYVLSQYTWRVQFLREDRPFLRAFTSDLRHPRYDYLRSLCGWAEVCDWDARAIPFQDRRSVAPLVERIATELGLADRLMPLMTKDDLAFRTNQSLGPIATEISRRLRRSGVTGDLARTRAITSRIDDLARERGLDAMPFQGLNAEMVRQASERFSASNDRFARRIWTERWSERVADVSPSAVNELAGGELDTEVAEQLAAIMDAVRHEFGLREGLDFGELKRRLSAMIVRQARLVSSAWSKN